MKGRRAYALLVVSIVASNVAIVNGDRGCNENVTGSSIMHISRQILDNKTLFFVRWMHLDSSYRDQVQAPFRRSGDIRDKELPTSQILRWMERIRNQMQIGHLRRGRNRRQTLL
jgi:hypothetical protein